MHVNLKAIMKMSAAAKFIIISGLIMVVVLGCAPSIHEVTKVLSQVPIGTSRSEVWNVLVKAYPKDVLPNQLIRSVLPMSQGKIQADKNLIKVMRRDGKGFLYVYPSDLYDRLQDNGYFDMSGLIREASEGGASLTIIYDSNTNYLGFFGQSYK